MNAKSERELYALYFVRFFKYHAFNFFFQVTMLFCHSRVSNYRDIMCCVS
jgi:hypothetical protein